MASPTTGVQLSHNATVPDTGTDQQPPGDPPLQDQGTDAVASAAASAAASRKILPLELHELQALLQKGDLRTALYAARSICKEQPQNPYGPLAVGIVLAQSNTYPEAVAALQRSLVLNSETDQNRNAAFWGNLMLAMAYTNMGHHAKAREALDEAKLDAVSPSERRQITNVESMLSR